MNRNALVAIMWLGFGVMNGVIMEQLAGQWIAYGIGAAALIVCYILTVWLDWSSKKRKL